MRTGRILAVTLAAACALSLGACHKKKKDSGQLTGDEMSNTSDSSRHVTDPPVVDRDINETPLDSSGPLKDVYFDFDQYAIRGDQRSALDANGRWLSANSGESVLVEGHCDERGTEEYNLALGDRRANAARDYLKTLGVSASRMQTISYGKAYPADPGHDEIAWAKNRRAHFTLVSSRTGGEGRRGR